VHYSGLSKSITRQAGVGNHGIWDTVHEYDPTVEAMPVTSERGLLHHQEQQEQQKQQNPPLELVLPATYPGVSTFPGVYNTKPENCGDDWIGGFHTHTIELVPRNFEKLRVIVASDGLTNSIPLTDDPRLKIMTATEILETIITEYVRPIDFYRIKLDDITVCVIDIHKLPTVSIGQE